MLISLFPTPFDHIHFHPTLGLDPALILTLRRRCLLDKAPRLVFILILRRVPQPLQTFCRIFEAPQLSGKCLKVAVFGGLALPHI